MAGAPLVRIEGLSVSFGTGKGEVKAVRDISFDISEAETVAAAEAARAGAAKGATGVGEVVLPGNRANPNPGRESPSTCPINTPPRTSTRTDSWVSTSGNSRRSPSSGFWIPTVTAS